MAGLFLTKCNLHDKNGNTLHLKENSDEESEEGYSSGKDRVGFWLDYGAFACHGQARPLGR